MNVTAHANTPVSASGRAFVSSTPWAGATCESLTGDASPRRYFRLRHGTHSAILMDASANLDSVPPFIQINEHLRALGFSAPEIFARDIRQGFLVLEDFGDDTFAHLLEADHDSEELFTLATEVLIALHRQPQAIPTNLRRYDPEKMLSDIELFLDWRTPDISDAAKADFRAAWLEALPQAHQVPASLLMRDYHVANLMLLRNRAGIQRAGLLDFQDAYEGPVTYDLVSLLEDARRDVSEELKATLLRRYLDTFPSLDRQAFEASLAIVAAQRHTRVLAIFERLSRREGKHGYKEQHSPRVERRLQNVLQHPALKAVKHWMARHAW